MKKIARRNFFIKKDLQGKLILGYFLFVMSGCLLFIVLLSFFSADTLTISYIDNDLQLGQTPIMLFRKILAAHWILIVFGSLVLIVVAMIVTHRIAGPLFRFEKTLDSMLARNLSETIYLRDKDEGKELAIKINAFNTEISQTLRNLRQQSAALEGILGTAKEKIGEVPPENQDELRWLYWSMEDKNRRITALCETYKLKDES